MIPASFRVPSGRCLITATAFFLLMFAGVLSVRTAMAFTNVDHVRRPLVVYRSLTTLVRRTPDRHAISFHDSATVAAVPGPRLAATTQGRTGEITGLFKIEANGNGDSTNLPFTDETYYPEDDLGTLIAQVSSLKLDDEALDHRVLQFVQNLHSCTANLYHAGDADHPLRENDHLKSWIIRQVRPYCLNSGVVGRIIHKPRGYAGDYLSIEYIYNNVPVDNQCPLGRAVDQAFLTLPAAKAVRNRRVILAEELRRTIRNAASRRVEVTSLACGPAREVHDFFQNHQETTSSSDLAFHLVDLDEEALQFVEHWRSQLGPEKASRIHLYQKNLIWLMLGKETLDLPPQDLVYTMGLIDYFDDKVVIRLLNFIHDYMLRPGGRVIVGNFHSSNPTRGLMETVLDWHLIHRTEEDMDRLFRGSHFERCCTKIVHEEQGVQIFACCEKGGHSSPKA